MEKPQRVQHLSEAIDRIPDDENIRKIVEEYFYLLNKRNKTDRASGNDTYICYIASYLYYYFIVLKENEGLLELLCKHINKVEDGSHMLPYDFIAHFVYQSTLDFQDLEKADFRNGSVQLSIGEEDETYKSDQCKNLRKTFNKIDRHILLALQQKYYIDRNIIEVSTVADELKKKVDNTDKKAESFLNKLQNTTNAYVAILGIFATIFVSVMGGINLFGSITQHINNKIDYVFYMSTGLFCLLIMIFFLFTWIDILRRETIEKASNITLIASLIVVAIIGGLAAYNSPESIKNSLDDNTESVASSVLPNSKPDTKKENESFNKEVIQDLQ